MIDMQTGRRLILVGNILESQFSNIPMNGFRIAAMKYGAEFVRFYVDIGGPKLLAFSISSVDYHHEVLS